jgi:protein tyrosine phosphatase (PTP) superfamily phosphohydrolase (DUF442 family)
MTPDLYWIPGPWKGRLAISKRPRGGDWLEDEVRGWKNAGVDSVVSLLEPDEEEQLGISDEGRLLAENGIRFRSFPVADRGVPSSLESATALLNAMHRELERGSHVAVHCRQGIGCSAIVAVGLLMAGGSSPDGAIELVKCARGLDVPETDAQRKWLLENLADAMAVTPR